MENINHIEVFTDGGSRGNPGHAGIGIIIKIRNTKSEIRNIPEDQKAECKKIEIKKYIGIATNNQAEYTAVIEALKTLNAQRATHDAKAEYYFYLDSQLVVEQLNGNYKLKNEGLKPLFWEIRELIIKLGGNISFTHISRDKNIQADRLVNEAIDEKTE